MIGVLGGCCAAAGFFAGRAYPVLVGSAGSALPSHGVPRTTPPANTTADDVARPQGVEALSTDDLEPSPPSRAELPVTPVPHEPSVHRTGGLTNEELKDVLESLGSGWASEMPEGAEATGPEVGGVPHGEWQLYYGSTGKTDTGRFIFGRRFGTWIVRDSQGNVIQKRAYVDGKISGSYEWVDPETGTWTTTQYENGMVVH